MEISQPALDERHTKLLHAAARAAQSVTSILDPALLLQRTVNIICEEVGFDHAGVFVLDESRRWAELRAASGLVEQKDCRLAVEQDTLIGQTLRRHQAQVEPDLSAKPDPPIPCMPPKGSAMALPLAIGAETIGALLVQSDEPGAFAQADTVTLQIIADQLAIAINNSRLHRQIQELIYQNVRRARLLEAADAVSGEVVTILDLDELLPKTVDIICEAFGFYYAGIFLLDPSGERAVLRAGYGPAGAALLTAGHQLAVEGNSMIGTAIRTRQARIALDVDKERTFFRNPHLSQTRSEMALPLIIKDKVLGAVTIQSTEERAFSPDDIQALQTMADYLAVAIHNAQALQELEETHAELMRSKTFEVIATATGEAIHWVGNKAAPIRGSVARIAEDLSRYLVMIDTLLEQMPTELREHKFYQMLADAARTLNEQGVTIQEVKTELERQPLNRLQRVLNIESLFEDLHIIQTGADAILNIKEDLVGPARQRQVESIDLSELLKKVIASQGIAPGVVHTIFAGDLPPVRADRRQLDRVFVNLIKNAMEAMASVKEKKLLIWARPVSESGMVEVDIIDSGVGIPPDQIDKIWVAFYTTKGDRGGTGLGLPACLEIVKQSGGKIWVESEVGEGTTFTVSLPAAK